MSDTSSLEIYAITPRTNESHEYWANIERCVEWSAKYGLNGVLVFTGNDVLVDPWLTAQVVLARTAALVPIVAVNPIYMHPFATAKLVASLAYLYGRRVYLNMVTGTALSYLESLGEELTHAQRYERLAEYIAIVTALVKDGHISEFNGAFYCVKNLTLAPRVPEDLAPEILIAGHSDDARRVAAEVHGIGMQMLQSSLDDVESWAPSRGVHFGLVTRESDAEAWQVARKLFPESPEGEVILDISMQNTDSAWKRELRDASNEPIVSGDNYWLEPFRSFQADCPYYVGGYDRVADLFERLAAAGARLFILDVPADEEEFAACAEAVRRARLRLATADA